jgi:hypothetical protein
MVKLLWASFYFPYYAQFFSHYRNAAKEINALVPMRASLCDYGIDNQHLVYYLERPVTIVDTLTQDALKHCNFVLAQEGRLREPPYGLRSAGAPIKARKSLIRLYEVDKQERPFEVK